MARRGTVSFSSNTVLHGAGQSAVMSNFVISAPYLNGHSVTVYSIVTARGRLATQLALPLVKADLHIACRAHAVPLPCRAAKGLECVFPI